MSWRREESRGCADSDQIDERHLRRNPRYRQLGERAAAAYILRQTPEQEIQWRFLQDLIRSIWLTVLICSSLVLLIPVLVNQRGSILKFMAQSERNICGDLWTCLRSLFPDVEI